MDDCIEAQWGLYIEYMRETLDYNIIIIPLTPPQMQHECNDVAFEEFTKHTTKTKLIDPKSKNKDINKACNS
jgi:hypothetical protein